MRLIIISNGCDERIQTLLRYRESLHALLGCKKKHETSGKTWI